MKESSGQELTILLEAHHELAAQKVQSIRRDSLRINYFLIWKVQSLEETLDTLQTALRQSESEGNEAIQRAGIAQGQAFLLETELDSKNEEIFRLRASLKAQLQRVAEWYKDEVVAEKAEKETAEVRIELV